MDFSGYEPVADAIRDRLPRGGSPVLLVGVAGSVCVGKTTACEQLQALLHPVSVERVTTDGFLYPNAELDRRGLGHAKGFPESYDADAIRTFLHDLRAGEAVVTVPVYSHVTYDVVPDERRRLADAAVVIVEGVNALQFREHLDLGVYIDAPEAAIERWYADRLVGMFADAPPGSFYSRLGLDEHGQREFAAQVWAAINHVNLAEHILPTRAAAEIVIEKGWEHEVVRVRFAGREP